MKPDFVQMATSIEQRCFTRRVAHLADALYYALNIQDGACLVPFLAPSQARDNREAVAVWLFRELQHPDTELSRHCIEVLLPRLERRLHHIQESLA